MPLGTEKEAVKLITDAFLKKHGLTGNTVMTPNITATVHVLPKSSTFSGGNEFLGAWVEWKVPSFALANRDVQKQFFADAFDKLELVNLSRSFGIDFINIVEKNYRKKNKGNDVLNFRF
ncbi:MAG: hypothetical protein HQ490_10030 [Lutibacter sp.]|nr:hypothetical protein [Lutibacter sp.]